jgi:glutamate 5-kinase
MSGKFKRIIFKFGSGILSRRNGSGLDAKQFARLTSDVAQLVLRGHECAIVSSGAVAAGLGVLGLGERPNDLATLQACAAVGQSKLMQLYETMFARHELNVAQLLVTHGDIDSRTRYLNAKHTLARLLECKNVVPIINENDSVAVEELRFGDNDRLSAEIAMLAGADLLILLTGTDGLLDSTGKTVPLVTDIESASQFVNQKRGKFSVGGMVSKLQAVKAAVEAGIPTVIASGKRARQIAAVVAGKRAGTRFIAKGEDLLSAKDA